MFNLILSFSTVLLQHGLVVNRLGRADSFFPIDQLQEHNNAGIRVRGLNCNSKN